jgi:hypothetical protein
MSIESKCRQAFIAFPYKNMSSFLPLSEVAPSTCYYQTKTKITSSNYNKGDVIEVVVNVTTHLQ